MLKKVSVCNQRGLKEFHLYRGVKPICPAGTVDNFSKDFSDFSVFWRHRYGCIGTSTWHVYLFPSFLLKKYKDKLILEVTENQRLCTSAGSCRLHLLKSLNNWFLLCALHILSPCIVGIAGIQHLPALHLTGFLLHTFLSNLSSCFAAFREHTAWRDRGCGCHTMISDNHRMVWILRIL